VRSPAAFLIGISAAAMAVLTGCSPATGPAIPPELLTMQETASAVSAPALAATLPASWDENWFSSPAVYDLDNDDTMEIIASRHSVLYVWKSGRILWRAAVGENAVTGEVHGSWRMYCSPVVGDLNGDGFGEIAIAFHNQAAVYDRNGMLLPNWPRTFPGPDGELRTIAASDINADGRAEILVVKTSDGPATMVWTLDGNALAGWPQVRNNPDVGDFGGYNQNIGVADLDGDGESEIVSTYDICNFGIFHADGSCFAANAMFARAGPYSGSVPMFHDIALAQQGWGANGNDRDEFTDSPPDFADLDNDGLPEIILYSDHEKAGEYINRGNSLWALNPDMTRVAGFERPITTYMPCYTGYQDNIVQVAPAPCIAELDGSGPCIIVPSYDGHLRCYAHDGAERWRLQFGAYAGPFIGAGEAVAGDLDNDGISEIVFTTYAIGHDLSNLVVLDAAGRLLHRIAIPGRGSMAAPTLADVDNDGILEIVVSLKDALGGGLGGVRIWRVASATANRLDWPTGRGNYLRTGMGIH